MTIKDARRCGMKLNEIEENSDIYEDMKKMAFVGDIQSMIDFGMWNEIHGDMHMEQSKYYYNKALYWYKRAWDEDSNCSGEQAYNELSKRIKR